METPKVGTVARLHVDEYQEWEGMIADVHDHTDLIEVTAAPGLPQEFIKGIQTVRVTLLLTRQV